ncbi:hypothetical protein CYMTET_10328 [Cymbomonas tetramitiformis]|uniref:Uncharacterized protein n=1 Tax=Cymbomonas tetramitiformis TaxID=36881 RepID=A0AAE0GPD3_9CHLO|nr:hypothetical protein CYMTET_10328 [Cymbomonas tetramitiformis]
MEGLEEIVAGVDEGRWAVGTVETHRTYNHVAMEGYNGKCLDRALGRLSKHSDFLTGCWDVEYIAGIWSVADWAALKLRGALTRLTNKIHAFSIRGVYVCKLQLPEGVPRAAVRDFLYRCVDQKYKEGAVRTFVKKRTGVVRTGSLKILDIFKNTGRAARCVETAECNCSGMPLDLPRKHGHVCFWTGELEGVFARLNRSLKDTPTMQAATEDDVLKGVSAYLSQFNGMREISDTALRSLFPWRGTVDGRPLNVVLDVTDCILFVAVCGDNGLLVQIKWDRFIFLLKRLDAYRTVRGLLRNNKFAFLAPQSALGFKDRSTGAKFEVAILLIQNTAAARLRPVTGQGLARRFAELMKGDVTAGLLLQKFGTHLMETLDKNRSERERLEQWGDGRLTLEEARKLTGRMTGLVRGVLDRNVAVGFGVCGKLYREWLEQERDGGKYEWWERKCGRLFLSLGSYTVTGYGSLIHTNAYVCIFACLTECLLSFENAYSDYH